MSYMAETGKGKVKKEALLTDSDNLWAEFRHEHIGKVLTDLGEVGLSCTWYVVLDISIAQQSTIPSCCSSHRC